MHAISDFEGGMFIRCIQEKMYNRSFLKTFLTHLKQHTRMLGFAILVIVTVYGLYHLNLSTTDWKDIITHWQAKGFWLLMGLALVVTDYALEAVCWMWLYRRFQMPVCDGAGLLIYLSGHAGLFMPAQIGRLIRPDTIARLGKGNRSNGVKAEAALLFLDATAALVTIGALTFFWIKPLAIPLIAIGLSVLMIFLAARFSTLLSGTRMSLPKNFWRSWQTFAILWLLIFGWLLNGMALYVLVWDLGNGISALETIFFSSLSRLIGSGTGIPGGIGAIEGFLGVSLRIMEIPAEHIIPAVGVYRLVSYWMLLPVGWIALLFVNRRVVRIHNNLNKKTKI